MVENKLFHRNFTLIIIGQIISLLGNATLSFAIPLYLLDRTGSGTIFGVVMAISIIPTILLSPIGGIIADRVNRRNIMVILDFITFIIVLLSIVFIKNTPIFAAATTLILLSIIRSFYQPAVQASIPTITSSDNLLKANSLVNMVNAVSMLIGPILGGFLYGLFGITPIILLASVAFLLSAIMELFINMPFKKKEITTNIFASVKNDFSESILFITKEKPFIAKTIGVAAFMNLTLSSALIIGIPYIINITLGLNSELYGIAQSAIGIGALVGGISVGVFSKKLTHDKFHIPLFLASIFILPIGIALMLNLSAMTSYFVIIISAFLVMACATMFSITAITLVQQVTPNDMIGKVMSFVTTLSMCAQPIGQSMYGALFDKASNHIYVIIFVTVALLIIIVAFSRKIFKSIEVNLQPSL